MSDQDATQETEATEEVAEDTAEVVETEAPEDSEETTEDWRSNFDADKASARIAKLQSEAKNLRTRAKTAEEKAASADEKDKTITSLQRELLQERVARKVGLPDELVERLRGENEEELLADAEKLIGLVSTPKATRTKPTERLRGGGDPDADIPELDPAKLADAATAARGY